MTFEGVKWWRHFNGGRYMIPDLRSSRGKSTTSENDRMKSDCVWQDWTGLICWLDSDTYNTADDTGHGCHGYSIFSHFGDTVINSVLCARNYWYFSVLTTLSCKAVFTALNIMLFVFRLMLGRLMFDASRGTNPPMSVYCSYCRSLATNGCHTDCLSSLLLSDRLFSSI